MARTRILIASALVSSSHFALAASREKEAQAAQAEVQLKLQYLLDQWTSMGWSKLALVSIVSSVVGYLVLWPMSKMFAGKNGTWLKTLIYFGQLSVVGLVFMAIAYVSMRNGWILLLGGTSLGTTVATVRLAMQVYELSIGRGILAMLCLSFASGIAMGVTESVVGDLPGMSLRSPEEERVAMEKWRLEKEAREKGPTPSPATVAPSATPVAAPLTVQDLYTNLLAERQRLDVNDLAAVARFNEHVAAYNAAKAAAQPTTPVPTPHSVKPTPGKKKKAK